MHQGNKRTFFHLSSPSQIQTHWTHHHAVILFSLISNKTCRSLMAARLTRLTVSTSSQFYRGSLEIVWLFLSSECLCVLIGMCKCMWQFLDSHPLCTTPPSPFPLLFCGATSLFLFIHYLSSSSLSIYISSPALLSSTSEHQSHF